MDQPDLSQEQIEAAKAAIYPFVTAYGLPMNPENVDLLAVAVLLATPDHSLEEIRLKSEELLALERKTHAAMMNAMERQSASDRLTALLDREKPTSPAEMPEYLVALVSSAKSEYLRADSQVALVCAALFEHSTGVDGGLDGHLPAELRARTLTESEQGGLATALSLIILSSPDASPHTQRGSLIWAVGKAASPEAIDAVLKVVIRQGRTFNEFEILNAVSAMGNLLATFPDLASSVLAIRDPTPVLTAWLTQRYADPSIREAVERLQDEIKHYGGY